MGLGDGAETAVTVVGILRPTAPYWIVALFVTVSQRRLTPEPDRVCNPAILSAFQR